MLIGMKLFLPRLVDGAMKIVRPTRYLAVREPDDSWSVIIEETGLACVLSGVPMVLLTKENAVALADLLNHSKPSTRTLH